MEDSDIKILYVDDEDTWRVVFQRNMNGVFNVITARNAEEGWELLKKHCNEIGVIISDQRMPGRPGIELLKQARAYYPKIVRIITTGFSDSTIAVHATNQGAVYHYISKPWNADELVSIVRRSMDFFRLRRERDHLLERKLSTIQRKNLESKLQCLLVFCVSNQHIILRSMEALSAYLGGIRKDPGGILDVKSVFRQTQSELGSLLLNLDVVKNLNHLPQEILATSMDPPVDVRHVLLRVRDECSQVIYSVRNTQGLKMEDLTEQEHFVSESLLQLVGCWMGAKTHEKLLEISESRDTDHPAGVGRFLIRICNYSDPTPFEVTPDDPLFNGINLGTKQELAWLKFLLVVYHFGGTITPIHLSAERMVFEIREFDDALKGKLTPDAVVADLIRKFEGWNYDFSDAETDLN